VLITGLTAQTTYHYSVVSQAITGSPSTSTDHAFLTQSPGAPVISAVSAAVFGSSATISWTTDKSANSLVEYGLAASYGNTTTLNTSMVTSHSEAVIGLQWGTLYHYRVKSTDAQSNMSVSGDYTLTTMASPTISASITSPTGGASVANTVSVVVAYAASGTVARVELWADGAIAVSQSNPVASPVTLTWKATTNGSHQLQAKAYDTLGNSAASATVGVSVGGGAKVVLASYNGSQQQDAFGNTSDAQPRALILSRRTGLSQVLLFSDDIQEASLMDSTGRVWTKVSKQGGAISISLQAATDGRLGMKSGVWLIQIKDSSGHNSIKPLDVVK
jgi:hypothetical protein